MLIFSDVCTNRLVLKNLDKDEVGQIYLDWLFDDDVTKYLELRHDRPKNIKELQNFVYGVNLNSDSLLLGIFYKETNIHIGNIKIGPINVFHKRGDIGFFIGNRSYWGKGLAAEAVKAVTYYAFKNLNVEKITASCYSLNVQSSKTLIKAGFIQEARLENHLIFNGKRVDKICFAKFKD